VPFSACTLPAARHCGFSAWTASARDLAAWLVACYSRRRSIISSVRLCGSGSVLAFVLVVCRGSLCGFRLLPACSLVVSPRLFNALPNHAACLLPPDVRMVVLARYCTCGLWLRCNMTNMFLAPSSLVRVRCMDAPLCRTPPHRTHTHTRRRGCAAHCILLVLFISACWFCLHRIPPYLHTSRLFAICRPSGSASSSYIMVLLRSMWPGADSVLPSAGTFAPFIPSTRTQSDYLDLPLPLLLR